jgi:hypothetical protein
VYQQSSTSKHHKSCNFSQAHTLKHQRTEGNKFEHLDAESFPNSPQFLIGCHRSKVMFTFGSRTGKQQPLAHRLRLRGPKAQFLLKPTNQSFVELLSGRECAVRVAGPLSLAVVDVPCPRCGGMASARVSRDRSPVGSPAGPCGHHMPLRASTPPAK